MDTKSFHRKEKLLKLHKELLAIEEERLRGAKYHSIDEIDKFLDTVIENVENGSITAILDLKKKN